jgi:hypothetical protein
MTGWIFAVIAALLALLGAVLASHAVDIGMATFGFGLIVFGVWLGFWLMKDYWDELERTRPRAQ